MNWEKIQLGLKSAVGGGIALAIIGFTWGGWVTGGTAREMAKEVGEEAVVDRLTPICVAQFNYDPEKDRKFKELKGIDSWKRDSYVEKEGWATMPSEKKPDIRVAAECARQIIQTSQ